MEELVLIALGKSVGESEDVHETSLVSLRRDLRELGVLGQAPSVPTPKYTRGVDVGNLSTIAMIATPASAALTASLKIILDWMERREGRSAIITKNGIHLRGLSRANLDKIVKEWSEQSPDHGSSERHARKDTA